MKIKEIRKALEARPMPMVLLAVEVLTEKLWEEQKILPPKSFLRCVQLFVELAADETETPKAPEIPDFDTFCRDVWAAIDEYNRKPGFMPVSAAHERAFCVASAMPLSVLSELMRVVSAAIENGDEIAEFLEQFRKTLAAMARRDVEPPKSND